MSSNQLNRGAALIDRDENATGRDDQFACRAKGQGLGGLRLGARLFRRRLALLDEEDVGQPSTSLTFAWG